VSGRCGEPIECAEPDPFLLSYDASFIAAADLAIDGGCQGQGSEGVGETTAQAGST